MSHCDINLSGMLRISKADTYLPLLPGLIQPPVTIKNNSGSSSTMSRTASTRGVLYILWSGSSVESQIISGCRLVFATSRAEELRIAVPREAVDDVVV